MFKRLFIGLMILSTLANDGALFFTKNVLPFFASADSGSFLEQKEDTAPLVVQEPKDSTALSGAPFVLTVSSLELILKSSDLRCSFLTQGTCSVNNFKYKPVESLNLCCDSFWPVPEKDMVLRQTDSSPPNV